MPASATSRTRTATAASTAPRPGRVHAARAPTRSPRRSSRRAPRRSPMVIMEPVQNSGGTFTPHPRVPPARARDLRRVRRPAGRRRGDLRLRPARRVVRVEQRYDYRPDLITCAKGVDERVRAAGRAADLRPGGRAVARAATSIYLHGITFGGHPIAAAVALKNLEVMEREDVLGNVRANEAYFADAAARPDGRARDRRRRARRGLLQVAGAGQGPRHAARRSRRGVRGACCAGSCRRAATRPA